jgi:PST family polysaccharide transporter
LTYGLVPATILLPVWFFQGTEKFGLLARIQLFSRGLYTAAIFWWIKAPDDLLLVPIFNSATALLAALLALISLFRTTGIRLMPVRWTQMLASLKDSSSVFISSFSVSLYAHSAILILGFFGNEKMVGQFAAVEKIILVFRLGLSTLFSVVYPRLCQLIIKSTQEARAFLRKLFGSVITLVALASLVLWYFPMELTGLVTGENDPEIVFLLRWMALVPLLIALNMASYQQLLAHKHQRYYSSILLTAALGSLALNAGLTPHFGAQGTAWSILFAESFITFGLLFATEFRYRSLSIWRKPG